MSGSRFQAGTPLGRWVNAFEETAIAVLLGLMTFVTFINVVLRYGFNSQLIWGLEVTLILFAWLVVFGVSYCVKATAHLGVDAVTNLLRPGPRRFLAILSGLICVLYAMLLLKGAWDYWAPFAGLDATTGRVFPTGLSESRNNSFYTTDQVPMLEIFRWLEPITLNAGFPEAEWEHWEKLPRLIPYAILPVGCALILFRFIQATLGVLSGQRESLIVSHEAEDAVEEAAALNREQN